MRKIVGGVVLGLLSLGSLTACEGLNNNLSIKDNGLVGVSKNYNSSNLALNSGKNYDYMITHSLPKGFTFKTENDGTPFSNKTLELIDTKVYILDYANDNYIEDPIQGWTSLEYYLYEDNDIPDVYKQDGFYLMLIAHEGWQDFSFDYNLVEDDFSEDDRYYVENLSYGYFDGLYEETLTLIDPANTQEIYMKDQDSGYYNDYFNVLVFKEVEQTSTANYNVGDAVEINGDINLDSLSFVEASYDQGNGLSYNEDSSSNNLPQDLALKSFLDSRDKTYVVGIDTTNLHIVQENDFWLKNSKLIQNNIIGYSDTWINVADLIDDHDFIGIIEPSGDNFTFGLSDVFDRSEEYEINGITFYNVVERDVQSPSISGTNNFIVNINNPLSKEEILSHIEAYDETDGEVSVYFESCDYDPSGLELGEFDAVVAAKDNSGNIARYDIVIHVVDINKPTYASGQTSYTTNYKTKLLIDDIKNALVFNDNYDEDLTLNVVSDNYSESYNTVGTYYVKVTATDSSDNVSDEVTITINVIDDVNPTIDGDDIIQANSDDLLTEEEILSYFTATDEYCTDATLSIENYSSYSDNYNVVSDYSLTIKAVDDYGNSITKDITIHVNDKNKPTFVDGTLSYDVSYDETLSLDTIKSNLQFNDDVDDSLVLNITSDTYTENKSKVGTYYVKVTATDLSNNVSDEVTVTINVYDHKAPVISSPGTIETGNNYKITIEEIRAKISVNDALDGPITNFTIEGYENYVNNYNIVGQYQLTIKANDVNGNNASATITINVTDKIAPEITFDDYFIVLQEGEELTEEMIKNMASKVLGIDVNDIVEVSGEYNTSEVGEYKIELRTVNNEVYTFNLSVNEAPEIVEYRALEWHEWLWKWFSILFNYEVGYTTESFWDFGTRCGYIAEVYSTGQIKVVGDNDTTESDGSTNEDVENKVIIEALSYQLCSIEQSDLQSIYYEKGHIYLIPKETYEDDGDQAILITDKVSFSDNYLNELVANEFDVVLVLEDSAPSDMMFTKYGVSFVVIETDNTYTANDFKMEVNNEFI